MNIIKLRLEVTRNFPIRLDLIPLFVKTLLNQCPSLNWIIILHV